MLASRDGVKDVCKTPWMGAGSQVLVPLSIISHRNISLAPVIQFLIKEKRGKVCLGLLYPLLYSLETYSLASVPAA